MGIAAITVRRTLALSAGIVLASTTAAAAHAAPVLKDPPCNRGEVCIYRGSQLITKINPVNPGDCKESPIYYTRILNRSDVAQRAWTGEWCYGTNQVILPGADVRVSANWSVGGWP